jgi:hypothetical protein
MSVMANAYPASSDRRHGDGSPSVHNEADADWDEGTDTERVTLREENARLRALVVQLSNLVLRNVVDQGSSQPLMPYRRPRLD